MSYTKFHKLFTHIHSNYTIFPLIQTTPSLLAKQLKSTQIHSPKFTPQSKLQSKHNINGRRVSVEESGYIVIVI